VTHRSVPAAADDAAAPEAATSPAASAPAATLFASLGLSEPLRRALDDLGFAAATPVQAQAIPHLLAGRDVLAKAQTGTGKTAAFALPILQGLDVRDPGVQAIVLAPTRELAIQVAEATQQLAQHLGNVGVTAIYGGEPITKQFHRLRGPSQIVVGTPGRVLDHLARNTLQLHKVRFAVLDEADEMLRMGFAEDVEKILSLVLEPRQIVLCSATMPAEIARIAQTYLRDPAVVEVAAQTRTAQTVEQRYVVVPLEHKIEALARVLACEDFAAALVFARTRAGCAELSELLQSVGIAAEPMHGDMAQAAREAVLKRLRNGQLRVLVATDVAARGLDVDAIDLVVNVEVPDSAETYVHRIGRTGRAGRSGKAILMVTPRQERRLRELERFTGQRMTHMPVPTVRDVEAARSSRFIAAVDRRIASDLLAPFRPLAEQLAGRPQVDLLAALVSLAWGDRPPPKAPAAAHNTQAAQPPPPDAPPAPARSPASLPASAAAPAVHDTAAVPAAVQPGPGDARPGRTRLPTPSTASAVQSVRPTPRVEPTPPARVATPPNGVWVSLGVGSRNGVRPADLVGALVREGGIGAQQVGAIDIRDNFTLVQLTSDAAALCMARMARSMVCGRYLQPRPAEAPVDAEPPRPHRPQPPRTSAGYGGRAERPRRPRGA
jgi:ATP-dependent RNA helicase DeaD